MRPLFWKRLLKGQHSDEQKFFWDEVEEPKLPVKQVVSLFAQRERTKKPKTDAKDSEERSTSSGGKVPRATFSALDGKRAQAVGITQGSCKASLPEIRDAILNMDASLCSLESIRSIYYIRASPEELEAIRSHLQGPQSQSVPLERADQFLYDLAEIPFFTLRIDCWLFREQFAELMFDLHNQIGDQTMAIDAVQESLGLRRALGALLAVGNYLNGGTKRGQADGFDLEILPKIQDVKTTDNKSTLMDWLVSFYCDQLDPEAGQLESPFPLPGEFWSRVPWSRSSAVLIHPPLAPALLW